MLGRYLLRARRWHLLGCFEMEKARRHPLLTPEHMFYPLSICCHALQVLQKQGCRDGWRRRRTYLGNGLKGSFCSVSMVFAAALAATFGFGFTATLVLTGCAFWEPTSPALVTSATACV